MPILSLEPSLFPESLFKVENASEHRWWVLHTRPRQEKSLARQLYERNIAFYLPLTAKRIVVRGKRMESFHPLFAGYVFLRGNGDSHLFAISTRRVARAIEVSDQAQLWEDLRQIHSLIASGASLSPETELTAGVLVEIQSGPLMGLRGKILKSTSGNRFVVQVDFIQRGASVLLDESVLTRVVC